MTGVAQCRPCKKKVCMRVFNIAGQEELSACVLMWCCNAFHDTATAEVWGLFLLTRSNVSNHTHQGPEAVLMITCTEVSPGRNQI